MMSDATTIKPNFLQFLGTFEHGELVMRLTTALEDVVAAMEQLDQDHGIGESKGSLDIAIKLVRKNRHYTVTVEHKTKTPKGPAAQEIMWANEGNSLVAENPRQQKLPFTEITRRRGENPSV
mgnify:CR=1 FL=1